MNRPAKYLALIILCLALALPAMIALSVKMLRLERSEREARAQAALEENVRLALWRMDSSLAPLFYRENARRNDPNKPPPPDPVLDNFILLHFEMGPDGKTIVTGQAGPDQTKLPASQLTPEIIRRALDRKAAHGFDVADNNTTPDNPSPASFDALQQLRNDLEWQSRNTYNMTVQTQQAAAPDPAADVDLSGYMVPFWDQGELLLAREETRPDGNYYQGCLLSWPDLSKWLTGKVSDLLPGAALLPVPQPRSEDPGRLLASLPVRLEPGPVSPPTFPAAPAALTLAAAWAGFILAAAAGSFLLLGALTLSERRAAFVSAVTHELRTPLTTFKMYTEMLADGMVPDPAKQRRYLETLRAEADRLGHLVENVLAYSRLEKKRETRIETVAADRLLEGMRELLATRARQAGMELKLQAGLPAQVRADRSAVERILYNLVDNSCKYAAAALDKTIAVELTLAPGRVLIAVSDHGPGIAPGAVRRLFQPFSRPANEAAGGAPGIGLGLALSRGLARFMNGDLRLDPQSGPGARFILSLPAE